MSYSFRLSRKGNNSLLYLAYTSVESLSGSFKLDLAFDLLLSALLGENIYNFGELLAHPIPSSSVSPVLDHYSPVMDHYSPAMDHYLAAFEYSLESEALCLLIMNLRNLDEQLESWHEEILKEVNMQVA
ncbi:26S proteasome non-ATPase regulatory subunit 13A [Artemisia annua]|uniref:26S proteasome non-ATPase regulatory subunit 13A n=1 Tax=Artemisia annua TaxID=35608 RepID=A0A2U1M0L1_ARTAN|nr:26S proteasome non-ATPase regulatory subunit 13A [Artemisia annua]